MEVNEVIKVVTDNLSSFFTNNSISVGLTVPTSGTYRKGDLVVNIGNNQDKQPMWICTVAGTPGSWVVLGTGGGSELVGDLSKLNTTKKGNVVEALNEVNDKFTFYALANTIGQLAQLNTVSKLTIVGAINEVNSKCGNTNDLVTNNQDNLVAAINEAYSILVSNTELNTSSKDVVGAINELVTNASKYPVTNQANTFSGINTFNGLVKLIKDGEVQRMEPLTPNGSCFYAFYKDKTNRSGYFGYESSSHNNFVIVNESPNADVMVKTNGTGKFKVNNTEVQLKTDNSLQTTSKDIVGAINEAFQAGNNTKQKLVDKLIASGKDASTSESWDELFDKLNIVKAPAWFNLHDTWINPPVNNDGKRPTLLRRYDVGGIATGDEVIAVGGQNSAYGNKVLSYNVRTNQVKTYPNLPIEVLESIVLESALGIHILSGRLHSSYQTTVDHYVLDRSTETYTLKTKDPILTVCRTRMLYWTNKSKTKFILMGGSQPSNSGTSKDVSEYYPESDTWTAKDLLAQTIYMDAFIGRCALTQDDKMMIFGGQRQSKASKIISVYDPTTGTMTDKTTEMPIPGNFGCAQVGNDVFLRNNKSTMYKYNMLTDTIDTVSPGIHDATETLFVSNGEFLFETTGHNTSDEFAAKDGVRIYIP